MAFWLVLSVGGLVGGILSRVFFPYEPGATWLLYGGAGGVLGALVAAGCWFLWKAVA